MYLLVHVFILSIIPAFRPWQLECLQVNMSTNELVTFIFLDMVVLGFNYFLSPIPLLIVNGSSWILVCGRSQDIILDIFLSLNSIWSPRLNDSYLLNTLLDIFRGTGIKMNHREIIVMRCYFKK